MRVNDTSDFQDAAKQIRSLLSAGDAGGAIAFAEGCSGHDGHVRQIRAYTYTEAGRRGYDASLTQKGVVLWERVIEDNGPTPDLLFNLANAEQGVVEAVGRASGRSMAFVEHRELLHRARVHFAEAGANTEAEDETRLTAWTNCGNAFDYFGRSFEALDCYTQAAAIDSDFGMASGNRGHTLVSYAPLVHDHQPMILRQAAEALDRAIADESRVLRIGGESALDHFRDVRGRITVGTTSHKSSEIVWKDPYLRWCASSDLFLHVSPECIQKESGVVDPLYFHSVLQRPDQESQTRVATLIDAFNAIKQDFISTRYLAWLATGGASPIKEQASEISKQSVFWDSAKYARWGVTTGLAGQALANSVNVMDKVASFVHLYFGTGRKPTGVYFNSLWHKRGSEQMDSEIEAEIELGNMGLLALCDLSCDHGRDTPLKEFVEHRHAATHRFLVMHEMGASDDPHGGDWLERISWTDMSKWLEAQLTTARAALIYLARAIDAREGRLIRAAEVDGKPVPSLPMWHAETEHPEA